MKLKEWYLKIYNKIFSVAAFKKLLKIPGVEKLLDYEVISYLVFGVLTTVVNFLVYGLVNKLAGADYETRILGSIGSFSVKWIYIANAIAWVCAVLFAYITNKLFVFESKAHGFGAVLKEVASFFGARIISFLVFEEGVFMLLTSLIHLNSWIAKIIVGIIVIIFNYVASKLVIFRKKDAASPNNTAE